MSAMGLILKHGARVRIERPTNTQDSGGSNIQGPWLTVQYVDMWIQPTGAFASDSMGSSYMTRTHDGLTAPGIPIRRGDRVVWGSRAFKFLGDIDAGHKMTGMLAHKVCALEEQPSTQDSV